MLEDFIESNQLQAHFSATPEGPKIKCGVANSGNSTIIVITLKPKAVSLERLREIADDKKLEWAVGKEVEQITGYAESLVPPVSVYGATVFIDVEIMRLDIVSCQVGEELFLNISPKEIVEANIENDVAEIEI